MERPPLPAVVLGIPLVLAVALALFAWPSARLEPRDLPIGVVGQAPLPAGFDVHRYDDPAHAQEAVREREVYAAIAGGTLYTASAGSPAVAQSLQQAVEVPRVVDLVPAPEDDPRGAALSASVLPLMLTGILCGLGVSAAVSGLGARALGLTGAAALAGLAAVAIVQGWLGALAGGWLLNAGVLALVVVAVGAAVAGAHALFGRAGAAAVAVLVVLIGNPWSGISSAPELLPTVAGVTGRLLPPGAGGTLLRSTAFFDGSGGTGALLVLLAWVAIGFSLLAVAAQPRLAAATSR
jgi:hypothetical protein